VTPSLFVALTRVGVFPGVNEVLRNFSKFDVKVLGGTTQYVECLVCGDSLSLHENPDSLAEELATGYDRVVSGGSALLIFMGVGN
jgi:hypothetical protein